MERLGKYAGRILSKTDIDEWADFLKKEYGKQLEKVDNFEDVNVIAQFDPNTNTIRYKENATEYFIAHESFHAQEMRKIGYSKYVKDAPLQGIKEADYTKANLIRRYQREKHVSVITEKHKTI